MFISMLQIIKDMFLFTGYLSSKTSFPEALSAEDEAKYIALYEKGDMEARQELIVHNLRLVAHIAKKYGQGNEIEDLISIGSIGLIKAVNTFNRGKGTALAAYAAKCIENAILSQWNNRRLRWRNGCLLRQNGTCWREWESAAIF